MLGNRFLARNATSHSPTRERRESFFAKSSGGGSSTRGSGNGHQPNTQRQPNEQDHSPDAARNQNERQQAQAAWRVEQIQSTVRGKTSKGVNGNAPNEQKSERPDGSDSTTRIERDIFAVQNEIHQRIDALVGDIWNLRLPDGNGSLLREHTVTQGKPFSLEQALQGKRTDIYNRLHQRLAETPAHVSSTELEHIRRVAFADMAGLEDFKKHLEGISVTQIPDQLPSELAKKGLGRIRGFYNQRENRVYLGNDLHGLERPDVLQHEIGHAILAGAEFYLDAHIYNRILNAGNEAEKLNNAFAQVRNEPAYQNADAEEKLIERYMDNRFGKRTEPSSMQEEAIFSILDRREGLQNDITDESIADALLQQFKNQDPSSALVLDASDAQALQNGLQALRADPDIAEEYRGCLEIPKALILKLFKRQERWESLDPASRNAHHFTQTETMLFPLVERAKRNRVSHALRRELLTIREAGKQSGTFNGLLVSLALPPPGQLVNERYRVYGDDKPALLEELINRYADYRADRDPGTYTHLEEVCLFSMLDPEMEIKPPFTREQISARIASASTEELLSADGASREGMKGYRMSDDHHGHEEEHHSPGTVEAGGVIQKINSLNGVLQTAGIQIGEAKNMIREMTSGQKQSMLIDELNFQSTELAKALQLTSEWKRCAQIASDWANNRISPEDFSRSMKIFVGGEHFEHLAAVSDLPVAERGPIAKEAIDEIQKKVAEWNTQAEAIFDYVEKLRRMEASAKSQNSISAPLVEMFSLNQLFGAVKNVYESYSKAWGQWYQLKESKLSKYLGDAVNGIPMSERAKVTLEMELDHKGDDIKKGFKEHLEHDLANFDHCIGHGGHIGLLDQHKDDPNYFRAVLEYMAEKSWLYDMDTDNGMIFGIPLKIGVNLPANWTEQRKNEYIRDLEQKQSKGEDGEKARGKSRVDTLPDIPPMIAVLQDELNRHNYWATYGIIERIMEKGKYPHSPIWASVTILNFIRDNPTARKYFPKNLTDQYGNIGLANGMIHKFFKLDRHEIERYQKGEGKIPFEEAGLFARTTSAIERHIAHIMGLPNHDHMEKYQKDLILQLISRVFAGQNVQIKGKDGKTHTVSIFQDTPREFRDYRNFMAEFESTIQAKELDDDYYNPAQDMYEGVLGSRQDFFQKFETASEGAFKTGNKGKMFLDKIIVHDEKLCKEVEEGRLPASALENYRNAIRDRMDYVSQSWTQPTLQIISYSSGTLPGKPRLILELMRRHMLSIPETPAPADERKTNFKDEMRKQVAAEQRLRQGAGEPFFREPRR